MGIINTSKKTQSTNLSSAYNEYYAAEADLKKTTGYNEGVRYQAEARVARAKAAIEENTAEKKKEQQKTQQKTGFKTSSSDASSGSNPLTNITNSIVDDAKKTIGGIADTVSDVANEAANVVNNAVNVANNAVSTVTNTVNALAEGVSKGVELVTTTADTAIKGIGSALSSASDSISNLFKSDEDEKKAQAVLNSPKADKGKKEANTKVETLSGDDKSAQAKPVAFVTQTVQQTTKSTKSEAKETDKEGLPKTGKLAKEAEKSGLSEFTDTVKSFSNELKDNINKASSSIQNFMKEATSTVDTVVQTAKGAVEGVVNEIKDTVSGVVNSVNGVVSTVVSTAKAGLQATISFAKPILDLPGQVLNTGREMASSIASAFPGSIGRNLNALSNNYFDKLTNKLAKSKFGRISNIVNKLEGISSADDVFNMFSSLGGTYGSNTNADGSSISGVGSADSATSKRLYNLAKSLCSGIEDKSGVDYAFNKDFYDVLLGLCADLGMSDLLTQLANCGAAQKYLDQRTMNLIRNKLPKIAREGDASTMKAAVDAIGPSTVTEPKKTFSILTANMNENKVKTDYNDYAATLKACNITVEDLVKEENTPVFALSAKQVSLMSSSNTTIMDAYMGSENRALSQAAFYSFGRK